MNYIKQNKIQIRLFKSVLFAAVFLVISSCANDDKQTVVNYTELVMADEFDTDGAPNTEMWGYDIGTGSNGWGNNELQYYTNRTENAIVQNGVLIISAKEESFGGSNYTSARILTKGKLEQTYGRFEARIRLPYGQGIWPAFWMLGADIIKTPFCTIAFSERLV